MSSENNTFQIMLFIIFGGLCLVGFISFALYGKINKTDGGSNIDNTDEFHIWGTLPKKEIAKITKILTREDFNKYNGIKYIQKDLDSFSTEFVNELASGRGPDLVIIPHEEILSQKNKLIHIQYDLFPLSLYESLFVNAANIFLNKEGVLALPMLVDPLVLYYNVDIQEKNKIRILPKTWEDVISLSHIIDFDGLKIKRGLINLGGVQNNKNIKDILSVFLFQAGNPIAYLDENGVSKVLFADTKNSNSTKEVFDFYTSFAHPKAENYTWDESLPEAQRFFTADELFLYIGYASEYNEIRKSNPNLRFAVTTIPKLDKFPKEKNFARVFGVAIPRSAKNKGVSLEIAKQFTYKLRDSYEYNTFQVPTALKGFDISSDAPSRWKIFFDSAFVSLAWYDTNSKKTTDLFKQYVRGIIIGQYNTSKAIFELHNTLRNLIR